MTSSIRFLGHAGLDLRLGGVRVICDPWLSPRGAYLASWHQFPRNDHLDANDLHDDAVVFVSSPRPDHFDADTLGTFPKASRLIVPAYPTPVLVDGLRALGFEDIVALPDGQPLELDGGVRLTVVKGAAAHVMDATLVLEAEGEVIVNQNDCRLDGPALDRLAALNPSVHFVQFSGNSYFPGSYEFVADQLKRHVDEQVETSVQHFITAATAVGARHVVPTGGPPCFVDEGDFERNFGDSVCFDADQLLEKVARDSPALVGRLRLLYPGDGATRLEGDWRFDGRKPFQDKRRYLEEYRSVREPLRQQHLADLRALATPVDVKELRAHLRDLFQFDDMTWDMGILLQVRLSDGPSVWIDFRKKPFRYLTECAETAQHVLTTASAWLSLVIPGKLSWHDLLMGHQATLRRDPDEDCPALRKHLDYRHDLALFELVRKLNPALITLQDDKMEYVCQRFCPHRGRDLEYATLERGVLTCTAHGWRFDLRRDGKCLWGGDTPLLVKEIRPLKG